jgi:PAS domain-containing protein
VGQSGLPGYVMTETSVDVLNLSLGVTLGEAVLSLDGRDLDSEINRIAHTLFSDGAVSYERGTVASGMSGQGFCVSVSPETYYLLAAKQGVYSEADLEKVNALAVLTARLFAKRQHLLQQQDMNLQQHMLQTQILDQIHESVITMDLAGFILSWNRGAEKLFGYRSDEVLGKIFCSCTTMKSQMMERQRFSIIFWSMVVARWRCAAEKVRRGVLGQPDFVYAHQSG